ncbi:hypothetical protein Clacol_005732 [Clathrus columnatus]|uniref:O-acyltransferase WSD1 C-terminal domain-containing protein n=1 Tax=Clathrus columnatus TaxID=1419009 RepID=A0AAV5AFN3_9AGAM|nr:hypothetical protein Clacol_005732 [Clathrus columnatus]
MSEQEYTSWNPVEWTERRFQALGGWLTNEYTQRANMIGGVDNLFLLLSEVASDFNPVCAAVYTFEKCIVLEDLESTALSMAEEFPKYKSRLTALGKKLHSPSFEPDPLFDVESHVSSTTLPQPAGKKELEDLMGRFIAKEWDIRRPLWEMLLVTNYHDEDGAQCALLSRAQYYMTSYFDELQRLINTAAEKLEAAKRGRLPPSEIHPSLRFLDHFSQTRPRRREREFACTNEFKLDDVKLCQHAFSGSRPGSHLKKPRGFKGAGHLTLNDVVCAVMVDAAESILRDNARRGVGPNRLFTFLKRKLPTPMGFFVPISLRQAGDWTLRNLSTGAIAYLEPSKNLSNTVSTKQLYKHMHSCRRELSLIKHSIWPKIIFELLQVVGQVPVAWPFPFAVLPRLLSSSISTFVRDWITSPVIRLILGSVPIIFTNVPGPTAPLEICGVKAIKWCALPPQAGKGTLGIGVISYNGGLCVSVAADSVPGTEGVARKLCELFEKRFKVYVERAREISGQ